MNLEIQNKLYHLIKKCWRIFKLIIYFKKLDKIAVYKDWVDGRIIDPLNYHEVLNAISWIIEFQKIIKKMFTK